MKSSLLIALNNISRYKVSSLGRSLLLAIFSFVIISALMFSISITNSISDMVNSRSSGNCVIVSADSSELTNISKTQYVNEAVLLSTYSFTSGSAEIEDIGTFHINCSIYKAQDINSLFPNTYLNEFQSITDDNLILAGRLPQNNNELVIDSRYIDKLQIYDYSQIIGKTIRISHQFLDETFYDVESAIIVGVYSSSFLDITIFNNSGNAAYCFMMDSSISYSGIIMAFCNLENIDKATHVLQEKYGDANVIMNKISTVAIGELINISSFIKKVMLLVSIVMGMVYVVVQIIIVTNYLNEKQAFISAISAFGLKKENLVFVFIFEYIVLLIIPFTLSCVLSAIFTKTLSHYAGILSGIAFNATFNFLPIVISFLIIFVISLITILVSVYLFHPKKNE